MPLGTIEANADDSFSNLINGRVKPRAIPQAEKDEPSQSSRVSDDEIHPASPLRTAALGKEPDDRQPTETLHGSTLLTRTPSPHTNVRRTGAGGAQGADARSLIMDGFTQLAGLRRLARSHKRAYRQRVSLKLSNDMLTSAYETLHNIITRLLAVLPADHGASVEQGALDTEDWVLLKVEAQQAIEQVKLATSAFDEEQQSFVKIEYDMFEQEEEMLGGEMVSTKASSSSAGSAALPLPPLRVISRDGSGEFASVPYSDSDGAHIALGQLPPYLAAAAEQLSRSADAYSLDRQQQVHLEDRGQGIELTFTPSLQPLPTDDADYRSTGGQFPDSSPWRSLNSEHLLGGEPSSFTHLHMTDDDIRWIAEWIASGASWQRQMLSPRAREDIQIAAQNVNFFRTWIWYIWSAVCSGKISEGVQMGAIADQTLDLREEKERKIQALADCFKEWLQDASIEKESEEKEDWEMVERPQIVADDEEPTRQSLALSTRFSPLAEDVRPHVVKQVLQAIQHSVRTSLTRFRRR